MRDPHSDIQGELGSGEKLLWSGKPRDGLIFRTSDIFAIPFSIFFCGFSIFWMVGASYAVSAGASKGEVPAFAYIFPLFGVPFVAAGLYMLLGRFWVEKAQRAQTAYGVTDERVIIISGLFSRTVKSLNLRTLADISMSEKHDGSGTISFGAANPMFAMFSGISWWPGFRQYSIPAFESIPNVRDVYKIIREQKK